MPGRVSSTVVVCAVVLAALFVGGVMVATSSAVAAEASVGTDSNVTASSLQPSGTIYVGSNDNNVYAIDAATGNEDWNFSTGGSVRSSPTVEDSTVYVGSNDNKLYALDTSTGSEQWNYSTGGGVQSSPVIVDSTVYFGSNDGDVYAVDADTGNKLWNFTTGNSVVWAPQVVGGTVYVASDDDKVYALDTADGSEVWNASGFIDPTSPTVVDGNVYFGDLNDKIYSYDADTGTEQWNFTGSGNPAAVTYKDGYVYAPIDKSIHKLDATDGTEQWEFSTSDLLGVNGGPTVSDGRVFAGYGTSGTNEALYALDASNGNELWNTTNPNAKVDSAPTAFSGTVFASSEDNNVYAFDASTGTEQWNYSTGNNIVSSPAFVGSVGSRVDLRTLGHLKAANPLFAPDLDNGSADPAGGGTLAVRDGQNISIDVSDRDFPGDTVNVSFYDYNSSANSLSDHTFINSSSVSSNGTVTVNWSTANTVGTYTWFARATDTNSTTANDTSQVFTFNLGKFRPEVVAPSPDDVVLDGRSVTLIAAIEDKNFPNDNVTVEFYNYSTGDPAKDTLIGSDTVDTDGDTAQTTWTVPNGTFDATWYIVAEDNYGLVNTTSVLSFGIAGTLHLRDQDDGSLITASTDVTIERPTTTEQRTITDGKVDLPAVTLDTDESVRVAVNATGFFEGSIEYNSVVGNSSLYLFSCGTPDCDPDDFDNRTRVQFVLDDQTGDFEARNTELTVKGPINATQDNQILHRERFDAANAVDLSLEQGRRYQLTVENQQGDTRVLGGYSVPNETFVTETLQIRPRDYNTSDPGDLGYQFAADWRETAGGGERIEILFDDPDEETTDLNITVTDVDSGDVLESWTFNRKGRFEADILVPPKYRNGTYNVSFVGFQPADNGTNKTEVSGSVVVGKGDIEPQTRLPDRYKHMIAVGFVLMVAALVGGGARSELGAIVAAAVAGMFFLAGWMPDATTGGMIALALAVAVMWKLRSGETTDRQGF